MPLPTDPQAVGSSAVETLLASASTGAMRTALGLGTLATQSGTLTDYLTTATAASAYVPQTRTINGHALTGNITISTITGNAGTVTTINGRIIQGANVTLTGTGTAADPYVISASGGGGGATNLSYTASPTNGIVASDTGNDATLPLATGTNAGLLAPAQHTALTDLATTYVPQTRTINGQALTGNITISTISGNSATATTLQTSRNIGGEAFNGSANVPTNDGVVVLLSGPNVTDNATLGRKAWWRVAKAFTLVAGDVSFDAVTAPTGATALADIEKNGTSIYSARPTIGISQVSSTAGTGSVVGTISGGTASFAVGDIIGIWVDGIGATIPGAGMSLTMNIKYGA